MELFEYLTAAVSIVLALALVRLVEGLRPALAREGRYWVHWGWVIAKIVSCLMLWWSFWGLRGGVAWSFPKFVLVFAGPIILYMQISFLVPRDPAGIASWREYFRSIQRPFYLVNALFLAYLAIIPVVFVAVPLPTPAFAVMASGCTLSLVAAFWDSPRVQEFIAVVMFAMIFVSATTLIFDPIVMAQG